MSPGNYRFHITIEPDGQEWLAYCPAMQKNGAAASGRTPQEALRSLQQILELVVEDMLANGETIPQTRRRNAPALSVNA